MVIIMISCSGRKIRIIKKTDEIEDNSGDNVTIMIVMMSRIAISKINKIMLTLITFIVIFISMIQVMERGI